MYIIYYYIYIYYFICILYIYIYNYPLNSPNIQPNFKSLAADASSWLNRSHCGTTPAWPRPVRSTAPQQGLGVSKVAPTPQIQGGELG